MGMTHTVYVGPYISYEMPKKTVPSYFLACQNQDCYSYHKEYKSIKFCSECGSAIEKSKKIVTEDSIDIYEEFIYKFNESLVCCGDYVPNVFIPNGGTPRESRFDMYDEGGCFDVDKEADLQWFRNEYGNEIDALTELLNNDVQIKWGVISYAR